MTYWRDYSIRSIILQQDTSLKKGAPVQSIIIPLTCAANELKWPSGLDKTIATHFIYISIKLATILKFELLRRFTGCWESDC